MKNILLISLNARVSNIGPLRKAQALFSLGQFHANLILNSIRTTEIN